MNRRAAPGEFVPGTFEQLLAELRNVPHVYQVLIANRSQTQFEVSVRVAECDIQSQLETRQQLATAIRNDQLGIPGSAFESLGLRSSLDIGASELQTGGNTLFLGDSDLDKAAVINLARGYREFEDLLRGRMGFDPVYEELGWYPKFVIDNRDLTNFLGLHPLTHPGTPWTDAPGRDPPHIVPVDLSNTADTTQQPTPTPTAAHTTGGATSQKEGGTTHQWWVERTATVLRERGYDVEIVDQTEGGSVPDLWCRTPDGDIAAVEVESKNASKPANLLTNLVRADRWDVNVIIIGTSKAKAKAAANKVSKPFKRTTPDRTLLYNATAPVTDGTHTQLLPDGVTTAEWWLTPDDELQIELDNELVTTGPATDSTATFDYPTPSYHVDNETHVVTDTDDTVIHRYDSKSALLDDWTTLRAPLVPTRLTYLDMATFKYGDDGTLEPFIPSATWDIDAHMDRYEQALQEYFETYTVEHQGADLRRDDVRTHALTWYRHQTQYKEPNKSMFGRCSPDTLQTKANSKDTGKIHYYDNRTWRYSPNLTSPDLPDIDQKPNYPDHWTTTDGQ